MKMPKNWRELFGEIQTTWQHEKTKERLVIEYNEFEYDEENVDENRKCKYCHKDGSVCECCELLIFNDRLGDYDSLGYYTTIEEAKKDAYNFMKENPKGFWEEVKEKKQPFIFR